MISYIVPNSILNVQDRHDERFFNRIDMMTIARLHDIADGDLCQLGCILENLGTGKGIPKDQQGTGEIAYLKVGNVARYRINFEGSESVSESVLVEHKMEPLLPGDILISRVGTVGNACMYTETDPRATPSDNVLVLRLQKHDHIRPLYVCTFLNSPFGQAQIRRVTKQSLQEVVNQTGIKSIVVPNPSIEKQKEVEQLVADRLDRVAKLKAQIEQEFTMADDTVRQALAWKEKSNLDAKPLDELMDIIKSVQDRAYEFSSKHEKAAAARRGRPKKEVGQPAMPGVRRPGRPRKAAAGDDLFA